jgi:hypothetical protein
MLRLAYPCLLLVLTGLRGLNQLLVQRTPVDARRCKYAGSFSQEAQARCKIAEKHD